jgi:hypothetical protein
MQMECKYCKWGANVQMVMQMVTLYVMQMVQMVTLYVISLSPRWGWCKWGANGDALRGGKWWQMPEPEKDRKRTGKGPEKGTSILLLSSA